MRGRTWMAWLVVVPLAVATLAIGPARLGGAAGLTLLAAMPIGISLWALLDAARRPQWAWALAERRQVIWMVLIIAGTLTVVGGLLLSAWYLAKVRPVVAAAEEGHLS